MGQITINTPEGPIKVNIEGDTPTERETQAILQSLTPKREEFDIMSASKEEIAGYARRQREMGIDPLTGEQISEEEFFRTYKAPGVDYGTGVSSNNAFSRYMFGRADTEGDKKLYLNQSLGEDGYYQDALGRFIANQKGRETMGLGEGDDIALDEEGLSWDDVKDFAGESGTEIAAGTGAALILSGYGAPVGIVLSSLAAGGAKILDEKIDEAQGIQSQTDDEVLKDAKFSAGTWAVGDAAGRVLSKFIGRIIKGPGGKANEATRKAYRDAIEKGYAPTIAGIDPTFRPILGRLQAVYEGVFPNKTAAQSNLSTVLKELEEAGLANKAQLKDLDLLVRKDINKFYSTANQDLANATIKMDKSVLSEIDKITAKLKGDKFVPKNLDTLVRERKKVFDADIDDLYKNIDGKLKDKQIIPTAGIKSELERLSSESIADVGATNFAKRVRGLAEYATAREVGLIRTGLLDASKSPVLIADANVASLGRLKGSVDRAFTQAEIDLADLTGPFSGGIRDQLGRFTGLTTKDAAESLNLLKQTNSLYRKGIKRFDNLTVQSIIKGARNNRLNYKQIFNEIILKDDSAGLTELLQAIKGVSTQRTLGSAGIVRSDRQANILSKIKYGDNETLAQAVARAKNMNPRFVKLGNKPDSPLISQNPTYRDIMRAQSDAVDKANRMSAITGTGKEIAEEVREGLAKQYLNKAVKDSISIDLPTGVRRVDPLALAANVREKGSVLNKLFGPDKKALDDVLEVLERNKATIAPEVLDQLDNLPLGPALREFQAAQILRKDLDTNTVINTLKSTNNPDVIAQTVFQNANSVREAKRLLPEVTMDKVRDASMGKILRQIGATTDTAGGIRLTDDFIASFQSGSLGKKLQSVLRGYGDETVESMFGAQGAKGLNSLANRMVQVSNAELAGKGGLAAPQIALGFTLGNLLMSGNFVSLLATGAGFKFMSTILRNPRILKMMMASRSKLSVLRGDILKGKIVSGDPLGQGAQAFTELLTQAIAQASVEGEETGRQQVQAVARVNKPVVQEAISQLPAPIKAGISNLMPSVAPPNQASSVSNINPIVLPNPNDQVLAERLNAARSA